MAKHIWNGNGNYKTSEKLYAPGDEVPEDLFQRCSPKVKASFKVEGAEQPKAPVHEIDSEFKVKHKAAEKAAGR